MTLLPAVCRSSSTGCNRLKGRRYGEVLEIDVVECEVVDGGDLHIELQVDFMIKLEPPLVLRQ